MKCFQFSFCLLLDADLQFDDESARVGKEPPRYSASFAVLPNLYFYFCYIILFPRGGASQAEHQAFPGGQRPTYIIRTGALGTPEDNPPAAQRGTPTTLVIPHSRIPEYLPTFTNISYISVQAFHQAFSQ